VQCSASWHGNHSKVCVEQRRTMTGRMPNRTPVTCRQNRIGISARGGRRERDSGAGSSKWLRRHCRSGSGSGKTKIVDCRQTTRVNISTPNNHPSARGFSAPIGLPATCCTQHTCAVQVPGHSSFLASLAPARHRFQRHNNPALPRRSSSPFGPRKSLR